MPRTYKKKLNKKMRMECKHCPAVLTGYPWQMAQHVRKAHPKGKKESPAGEVMQDIPNPYEVLMSFVDNPTDELQPIARMALMAIHDQDAGTVRLEELMLEEMIQRRDQLQEELSHINDAIDAKLQAMKLQWASLSSSNRATREDNQLAKYHEEKSA